MEIDKVDLKIIRHIESHGLNNYRTPGQRLDLPADEVGHRLKRLEKINFIKDFRLSLFFPAVLGGDWYWALAQLETRSSSRYLIRRLRKILPYLTEISSHHYLPIGTCPNVTAIFYTRDLKRCQMQLERLREIDYAEVYKIRKFSFPVKRELSKIEWRILWQLCRRPRASAHEIAQALGFTEREASTKMEKLLWHEENKAGIALILPSLNWQKVSNYTHMHIGLSTTLNESTLLKVLKEQGIGAVPYVPWFKKKYFQVEADIWNLPQFLDVFASLRSIRHVDVEGMLMIKELTVFDEAVKNLTRNSV